MVKQRAAVTGALPHLGPSLVRDVPALDGKTKFRKPRGFEC
jgi:hypothetical protein